MTPDRLTSSRPLTPVEKTMALHRLDAFRAVPLEHLSHLGIACREEWYGEGATLFRQGDPPGALYAVLLGRVRLVRDGATFAEAGEGEALGTWSLFDDHPRRASAEVAAGVRALVLERDDFWQIMADRPEIARSLVADLVRRLTVLTEPGGGEAR